MLVMWMTKIIRRYALNQSALYKCNSRRKLAKLLQINAKKLQQVVRDIPNLYSIKQIPKKEPGEYRTVYNSRPRLKRIQGRLYYLLKKVQRPEWLNSGELGKSTVDNVLPHQHSKFMLKLDISGFFDSCTHDSVYQFFHNSMKQSPDVASICADLCTLDETVVQGSPTSMVIAFYANQMMLEELNALAIDQGLIFSVYVDDIAFSSESYFDENTILTKAAKIIRAYGFKVKNKKVRTYNSNKAKKLTGVIVTTSGGLSVPNERRQSILANITLYRREKNPNKKDKLRQKLLGQIGAARQIEPDIYPSILELLRHDKINKVKIS